MKRTTVLFIALVCAIGAIFLSAASLQREERELRARVENAEAALRQCVTPIVVQAAPGPPFVEVAPPTKPSRPCARVTRPAASDRWIEHAAQEWRLCEEAPGP